MVTAGLAGRGRRAEGVLTVGGEPSDDGRVVIHGGLLWFELVG
jgi:hypothetical protein